MSTEQSPKKPSSFFDAKANAKALVRLVVIVAIVIGGIWLFIRFTAGKKAADTTTATLLRQPIELKNSIENLKASSWQSLAITLPYSGTLSVQLSVLKGNEIDVYVMKSDQLENVKTKQGFKHATEFEALKTKNYNRSARLPSGSYYLVMFDKTLGVLSAKSTDVKVNVRLEP